MSRLPLPALLSQALVAFTIEFEHRMPHRTAQDRGAANARGPWLVSQVMWANVLKYLGAEGVTVAQLHARARTTKDSLTGLQRWGYVNVADSVVTATGWGRRAQRSWEPLAAEIEQRWTARFGATKHQGLRGALQDLVAAVDLDLPDYLPITSPTTNGKFDVPAALPSPQHVETLDISVLLSRALLTFAVAFERESKLSLPVSANTLRVLDAEAIPLRDLPRLSGVSREGQNMAVGFLARIGCAVLEPAPLGGRGQAARLTEKGTRAQAKYRRLLVSTEQGMSERFGVELVRTLRAHLEDIVAEPTEGGLPALIFQGLQPYPDGWRAHTRQAEILPQYPMVLHRGGFPDGS